MQKITESYRLFFALWPETRLAAQIYEQTAKPLKACSGRRIPAHKLHITLAFVGSVDTEGMNCAQQAAARLSMDSFDFTLDQLGYWSSSHIVWLAPSGIPQPLIGLRASLVQVLAENCGYRPEARSFLPHISLMRNARRGVAEIGIAPINWQVNKFSLILSHTLSEGVEYEVLRDWPLRN